MKYVHCLICIVIILNIFIISLGVSINIIWEHTDFALILAHYQLVLSHSIWPYWKELILGCITFLILTFFACRYWKYTLPVILFLDISYLIKNHSFFQEKTLSLFKKEYIIPRVIPPFVKKNIIVISLESFENLFTWPDVVNSKNLLPNLMELKKSGKYFDGHYGAMESMKPTIPSFISVNCGIPRGINSFKVFEELWKNQDYGGYPNAICLSDLLKKHGYSTYFIMGANMADEGQDKFHKYHPMTLSIDRRQLKKLGYSQKNSIYRIPDSELFEFTKNVLDSKKNNEPFFTYLITGNTHGPEQYVTEKNCSSNYMDGRDAFLCSDQMVFNFIKWCQKQPWYKNTVIYLIGDHLAWIQKLKFINFSNIPNHPKRKIYNLVLDGSSPAESKAINKDFTQVDFAPTILESAGFTLIPRKFGIGVSLWSNESTLIERLGSERFAQELEKSQDDYFEIIYNKKK